MRAAVYARFSSENEREQSIEDQIRVCREFAKRSDISILSDHIYFTKHSPVTLTPQLPEVGKPYFMAACRFNALNLVTVAEGATVRIGCTGGGAGNRPVLHEVHGVDGVR